MRESEPKEKRQWIWDGCPGIVHAHTKSEARSAFKKLMDLDRLPPGAKVIDITPS